MNFDLHTLSQIYDEQIWLKISEADLKAAEPLPQDYSYNTGRYHAFINRLCLNALLRWMKSHLTLETEPKAGENLPIVWEFINGSTIVLGNKKLVMLPSDAIDTKDFAVPQEWVDIPNWAADYYLPVQVDLENCFLRIWGFISRQTLQKKADYDRVYRTYYVEQDDAILNLDNLWDACYFCREEKGEIAPLTTLSPTRVEELIAQLSQPSFYSPRLKVTFEEWGALLNEKTCLQRLYEKRLKTNPTQTKASIHLSQWFDGIIDAGWQSVENLFNPKTLVPAFRSKEVRGMRLDSAERIDKAVRQLYASQTQIPFPSFSPSSGSRSHTDTSIEALVHLLHHTENETIRWKAVEYLWAIAPNRSDAAIRKVMDVGVQLMGHPIALMIAVLRKPNSKLAILVRAYPMGGQNKLHPGLRLVIMTGDGSEIPRLAAIARENPLDDYISLNFCADQGDRFNVGLMLENARAIEQFLV